jgi:hypothetical protein
MPKFPNHFIFLRYLPSLLHILALWKYQAYIQSSFHHPIKMTLGIANPKEPNLFDTKIA